MRQIKNTFKLKNGYGIPARQLRGVFSRSLRKRLNYKKTSAELVGLNTLVG